MSAQESAQTAEYVAIGSAYGSDPNHHHIIANQFWCDAPEEAKCRTFPTCECENWCCCDTPGEAHDEGDHCCVTSVKSGQGCWIAVWVDAVGVGDSHCEHDVDYDEDGDPLLRDGSVACDWDEGICWAYAEPLNPPGQPTSDGSA